VADQPGEEYNIGPSTFSIPGFAGTPKYTSFYAKSFESMVGGVKKEVAQVTQEDLEMAEEVLRKKVLQECASSLRALVPPKNIFIEKAEECQIKDFSSSARSGQEADRFSLRIRAEGKILTLKKSDLADFAKNYIKSRINSDKEVNNNSLAIEYDLKKIDLKTEKIVLSLKISGDIFSPPDQNGLKVAMKGRALGEAKAIIAGIPETTSARVRLWPFWARRIPADINRIGIEIRLD